MFRKIFCGSVCLVGLTASLWGQSGSPICNGKTGVNYSACGQGRSCNSQPGNCGAGTAVMSFNTPDGCGPGSSNEFCSIQPVLCTQTFFCKAGTAGGACVIDQTSPLLVNGNPVTSSSNRGLNVSCRL